MKPFGRVKTVKQNPEWKQDYHMHKNGKKVANWWEGICECLSRSAMKQKLKQEIKNELNDEI